jgi:hypothetical protein
MLTPDTSHQKIFALIGARRSGKGTIARVGEALLGGAANVAHPTMDGLKTNFGLQPLINKRAAIIGDARLDEKVRVIVCDRAGQGDAVRASGFALFTLWSIPIRASKPWSRCPWSRQPRRNSA